MKLEDLKLDHLKTIAREHKLKGFSTMQRLPLVKHIRKNLGSRVKVVDGKPTVALKTAKGGSVIATAKKAQPEGKGPDVSDRLRALIDKLRGAKGGAIVSEGKESITNTQGGAIRMPMKGGTIINPDCSPDCVEPPACSKKKKAARASIGGFDPASGLKQKQYKDCKDEERQKMKCPANCKKAEGPSDAMKAGLAMTDVLTKITNKGIAAAFTLGKPAFFAACTAAGGPAGTAACKTLYDKMIKDPGYEKGMMDKANFSATELKLLEKVGNVRDDKISGAGAEEDDDIDFDDIKWGSFTEQLKRYNATHKRKFEGDKALCQFAEMIMKDKKKYSTKTQRRASFYLNVLAKKKCA